jgi:teichuronic acid biosynthesis glycosyltransferase TuaH
VYWAQDDFLGLQELLDEGSTYLIKHGERRLLERSDFVVAANPLVAESLSQRRTDTRLIPFGCDAEHFAATTSVSPATDVEATPRTAVIMGHIGDRIHPSLLQAVLDREVHLLIIGPWHYTSSEDRLRSVMRHPNVRWVGERPFETLPSYLAHASVGLVPYNTSRFNLGSFPLKTLEYLAAGLPVVATDLPGTRWLDSPDIALCHTPDEFADAVCRAISDPGDLTDVRRRQALAAGHTWRSRAAQFAGILRLGASEIPGAVRDGTR